MQKADIRSMNLGELNKFIEEIGEKPFRAKQIFEWINKKLVSSFDEMTNISKPLREKLKETAYISKMETVKKLISEKDGTRKYLFLLENDNIIESVLMKYEHGNSVCISSQAGCRMGCKFCASTLDGLSRGLTAGEYAAQVYEIQKDIGERVSNVVIMGGGEPFDNYNETIKFIKLINDENGLGIGQRHITVSTCGIADKIFDFAHEGLQVNLAVSLHAPNDEVRKQIMPVAKRFSLEELIEACKYYANTTKRRITYEYALIQGINDTKECANQLGTMLRHSLCHINLIPANTVKEREFVGSTREKTEAFAKILTSYGIETTIRRKLGSDIEAACGQLRKGALDDWDRQDRHRD